MRIKHLPPEAAMWTLARERQERTANVISIAEFVGRNKQRMRKEGESG